MRDLNLLDIYRDRSSAVIQLFGHAGDDANGFFHIPSPTDTSYMKVLASSGEGWEHVSVSRVNRCPNWPEMEHVKHLFFRDDETAMQLHVPPENHINVHPYCLHIWRPSDPQTPIPLPPEWMVG
jgi:hypothetical protein|uniref:DUF7694 domain-containing protein n=1 Tax=uncultured marine virus TaxID=186617 RepID=A0A0F7L7R7_9VIRU|nr:hypothetical protein [uncultured marine virus]